MAVAPTGMFSLQVSQMRDLLANCVSFQVWAGVDGDPDPVASALAKIVMVREVPEKLSPGFYAAVFTPEGAEYTIEGLSSGELGVGIKVDVTEDDEADAFFAFANPLGAVVAEMFEKAQSGGYQVLRRVRALIQRGALRDEVSPFYFVELSFDYGVESGGI